MVGIAIVIDHNSLLPEDYLDTLDLDFAHWRINMTFDIENLPILYMSHIRFQDQLTHSTGTTESTTLCLAYWFSTDRTQNTSWRLSHVQFELESLGIAEILEVWNDSFNCIADEVSRVDVHTSRQVSREQKRKGKAVLTPDDSISCNCDQLKLSNVSISTTLIGMCGGILTITVRLAPLYLFTTYNAEIHKPISRPILEAIYMNSTLDHLSGIMNPLFECEINPAALVFVEICLTHQ